jgi:hypothetical protein
MNARHIALGINKKKEVKGLSLKPRLFPFVDSKGEHFIVEVTEDYIRFYKNGKKIIKNFHEDFFRLLMKRQEV